MTQLFKKYLEYALETPSRKKEIVEVDLPRIEKAMGKPLVGFKRDNDKPFRARELLTTEAIESTTLIQTEMYNTVIEGAMPVSVFRNIVPIFQMKSNVMTVTNGATGAYALQVAEGAEIPQQDQDYGVTTFTSHKYGARPLISNEMIEDSMFDVIEMEVKYAGAKVENKLNQDMLTALLDGAGATNEWDTTGFSQGASAIASAMGQMRALWFMPDVIVMHPNFETLVLRDFVPNTGYSNAPAALVQTGRVQNILGLNAYTCAVADNSATYNWDYAAGGDMGAMVLDSRKCGAIGMRRDISVKKYDDPIRDLLGASVTARYAVSAIHANAICRIEF